jgi:transcription elongation factor/antiterminator RfaH
MFVENKKITDEQTHIPELLPSGRWYVAQLKPHGENSAILHLRRQGYDVFCPRLTRTVRHARKICQVLAPLFPGYLFLHFDPLHQPWRSVNGTFGVARLITAHDMPRPVPVGVVEELQGRIDGGGALQWQPEFLPGDMVRLTQGPFAEMIGTLEHLDAAGRVRVLLNLLGRDVVVAARSDILAPVA